MSDLQPDIIILHRLAYQALRCQTRLAEEYALARIGSPRQDRLNRILQRSTKRLARRLAQVQNAHQETDYYADSHNG